MIESVSEQKRFNVDVAACRRSFIARQERQQARREFRRHAALKAAINAITNVIPGYPLVRRAYLFGSVLRQGAFRLESDIDIAVEGVDRNLDFVIPHRMMPHVLVEVGVFETTARELSEKSLVEARLLGQIESEYPEAVVVRVVDGIGWIARGGRDLDNLLAGAHYVLTQSDLEEKLPDIVRQHVPEEFFEEHSTQLEPPIEE